MLHSAAPRPLLVEVALCVAEEAEVDVAIGARIEVVGEHLMMTEAIAIPAAGLKKAAG